MALYDGFFDAVQEEDGTYDRAYDSGDFTGYFANVIGSGVCIHNNPDSFKAEFEGGTLYLRPGYLFIQGYWLANRPGEGESDYKGYAVTLPGDMTGSMAVVAHLNLGRKIIEIEVQSVSQAYPDALVLAIVTADSAEDTRFNTDICGIIDTAGELSGKVEWALNYIDSEIESKLAAIEQDIAAQEARLDAKIAEVQAVADSIVPPPIGSIKFSASQDVGEEWLRCDGRFISESEYPELVAALGKLTPSGDQFQAISSGEIPPQISNGVVYGGRMWVYSYSANKLYGIDVEGSEAVKEIAISSEDPSFVENHIPTSSQPIALSIVESKLGGSPRVFLAQVLGSEASINSSANPQQCKDKLWIYTGEFSPQENSIPVSRPFDTLLFPVGGGLGNNFYFVSTACMPYVVSQADGGKEVFSMAVGLKYDLEMVVEWETGSASASAKILGARSHQSANVNRYDGTQKVAYNKKAKFESVYVESVYIPSTPSYTGTQVLSFNSGLFSRGVFGNTGDEAVVSVPNALTVAGEDKLILEMSANAALVISLKDLDAAKRVNFHLNLPSAARIFSDAAAYLWGKDIYLIFVGTGIIFSRTLEEGSFGYLDTTSVLGTITQFGYLDYSQSENTLYLLGQDTTNTVKVAKMELNTLYDYANDGAWLPMIASDGVPAYIKAAGEEDSGPKVPINVTVVNDSAAYASVLFNGEELIPGTYTRSAEENGKFSIGIKLLRSAEYGLKLNGSIAIPSGGSASGTPGATKTKEFNTNDYLSSGVTLTVYF